MVSKIGRNRLNLSTRKVITDASGNPIVFSGTVAQDVTLRGTGTGEIIITGPAIFEATGAYNTVDSVIIACRKAKEKTRGATLASDAFFPKRDAVDQAHKAGITAIIQPGGSKGDEEIIKACDEYGISMVFTGARHFTH